MKGRLLFILVLSMLAVSCEGWFNPDKKKTFDRVMILYSAGCNDLVHHLKDDITELKTGYIPSKKDKKALIVVSHLANGIGLDGKAVLEPETDSYIIRLYKFKKNVVADTLKRIEGVKVLTQPEVMSETLQYVKDNFRTDHYGMVFSSHATGWLPEDYYTNPIEQSPQQTTITWQAPPRRLSIPNGNLIESIGREEALIDDQRVIFELDIKEFARSIPMHLDYLLFDACFMAGVEVAYELRNLCDKIAFAPTEVISGGFDYKTMASHLLEDELDIYNVCLDFYNKYKGDSYGVTVTLVNCEKLEGLASVCKDLFSKYRDSMASINPSLVQSYFRDQKRHWFYDLEDILDKAGISSTEKNNLEQALNNCIIYKAATPKFITIKINTYSGFSMYLPCNGSDNLDDYYKTLAWNKATGLVQ